MRPSREELLVETAFVWAKRSTCSRLAVGAVIHRDGRILTQGYNGAPAGMPHCDHDEWLSGPWPYWVSDALADTEVMQIDKPEPPWYKDGNLIYVGEKKTCSRAVHAEANAIAFAARWGVGLEGAHAVITHQPCLSCAMLIVNAGLLSVTYVYPYRLADGVNLLAAAGIAVEQYLDWEEPRLIESLSDETH